MLMRYFLKIRKLLFGNLANKTEFKAKNHTTSLQKKVKNALEQFKTNDDLTHLNENGKLAVQNREDVFELLKKNIYSKQGITINVEIPSNADKSKITALLESLYSPNFLINLYYDGEFQENWKQMNVMHRNLETKYLKDVEISADINQKGSDLILDDLVKKLQYSTLEEQIDAYNFACNFATETQREKLLEKVFDDKDVLSNESLIASFAQEWFVAKSKEKDIGKRIENFDCKMYGNSKRMKTLLECGFDVSEINEAVKHQLWHIFDFNFIPLEGNYKNFEPSYINFEPSYNPEDDRSVNSLVQTERKQSQEGQETAIVSVANRFDRRNGALNMNCNGYSHQNGNVESLDGLDGFKKNSSAGINILETNQDCDSNAGDITKEDLQAQEPISPKNLRSCQSSSGGSNISDYNPNITCL